MAKIYSPPTEIGEAPHLDFTDKSRDFKDILADEEKAEEAYTQKIVEWAKKHGSSDLRGELIRYPVADGYALYVVYSLKPATLIHVPVGDAWQFQYADRFTAKDIKNDVARAQRIRKTFGHR